MPPMMPQYVTPGAWYPQPEGIMYGQPFMSQPWYPPHVPQWANMPEFQFVQGTGLVPLPPFQHPIQVSATSNLDDTQAKVSGEFHETSTWPPPTAAVQVQELDQLDPMLRPFIQFASRPENSSAKAKAQPRPRDSSLSRASFHGNVRTCPICQQDFRDNEELVRLRCRHTFMRSVGQLR